MRRHLAAILAADVAGYSQIMADDEAATLAALKSCLSEVVEPCVGQHDGRIFKTMGDGFLAEFPSVVEAVACAGDIQRAMAARNLRAGTLPLLFRIGVHLGDVMAEGDDVFGDGVNVAARLQSLAEAGGVRISRQAYDQVEGKLGVTYRSLASRGSRTYPARSASPGSRGSRRVAVPTTTARDASFPCSSSVWAGQWVTNSACSRLMW